MSASVAMPREYECFVTPRMITKNLSASVAMPRGYECFVMPRMITKGVPIKLPDSRQIPLAAGDFGKLGSRILGSRNKDFRPKGEFFLNSDVYLSWKHYCEQCLRRAKVHRIYVVCYLMYKRNWAQCIFRFCGTGIQTVEK